MTLDELRAKWERRRAEWATLEAHVAGAALATELLADLTAVDASNNDAVSLAEASAVGGYSIDRLQRLVAIGRIPNVGRKGKPKIQRRDIPVKPGYLRPDPAASQFDARRRIVAEVTGHPNP